MKFTPEEGTLILKKLENMLSALDPSSVSLLDITTANCTVHLFVAMAGTAAASRLKSVCDPKHDYSGVKNPFREALPNQACSRCGVHFDMHSNNSPAAVCPEFTWSDENYKTALKKGLEHHGLF